MTPLSHNRCAMRFAILILAVSLCFMACSGRYEIRHAMRKFVNADVIIPDDLVCIYDRQILPINKDSLKSLRYIIYYDSLECSSCRISHLSDIYPIYEMADTSGFSVLTIFSPVSEDVEDIKLQLMIADHPVPVYVDMEGLFRRQNYIPTDRRFHSFLIGSDGHPVFVGNPLSNSALGQLLFEVLDTNNSN